VYKRNASPEIQIKLMDKWINTLVNQEYYEVVPFFRNMKNDMETKFQTQETDNVTEIEEKESFLTILWHKIKSVYALIFK
jgi:hypothetical protein